MQIEGEIREEPDEDHESLRDNGNDSGADDNDNRCEEAAVLKEVEQVLAGLLHQFELQHVAEIACMQEVEAVLCRVLSEVEEGAKGTQGFGGESRLE